MAVITDAVTATVPPVTIQMVSYRIAATFRKPLTSRSRLPLVDR